MIENQLIIKLKDTIVMEIAKNKITEIFCIIDDFCQEYDKEIARMSICEPDGRKHRNRKWTMSRSEIMTILIYFHFNTFRNFKHYYLYYVKVHLHDLFPKQLSYNRFVELESRVAVEMMLFPQLFCFGRCTGISFIDSTCIPVCHNKRITRNKVFRDYAERGKSTMGWYFGFKLHLDGTKLNIGLESPLPIMAYLLACAKVTTFPVNL